MGCPTWLLHVVLFTVRKQKSFRKILNGWLGPASRFLLKGYICFCILIIFFKKIKFFLCF
jgi:hypothetical protein